MHMLGSQSFLSPGSNIVFVLLCVFLYFSCWLVQSYSSGAFHGLGMTQTTLPSSDPWRRRIRIPLDMKTAAGLEEMTRMANSLGQISKVNEERIISVQTLLNLRGIGFRISGEFPLEIRDESLFLWGSLAICPSEYMFIVSHEWGKCVEDARILFLYFAGTIYAELLSLTTSCATTCQKQPASSDRRLVLLEHEGLGLPVKVLHVGTVGQQPLMLERSWHPQDEQESFIFCSKYSS